MTTYHDCELLWGGGCSGSGDRDGTLGELVPVWQLGSGRGCVAKIGCNEVDGHPFYSRRGSLAATVLLGLIF